jgi:MFS family permease
MENRWLLAWGLGSVALGAASLLVPLYVVALGGDPVALGLLAATAALLGTPGALLWGRVADRAADRRTVVVGSLLGVAVTLGALPFLDAIDTVLAANALLWFVSAAAGPVLTLLVVADAPEREWSRRIAALNRYQGYGWAGGLVLGTVWLGVVAPGFASPLTARRWLFGVCAALAAVAAVAAGRWMPAPHHGDTLGRSQRKRVARFLAQSNRHVRSATFVFLPTRLYWATLGLRPQRLRRRLGGRLGVYLLGTALFSTGFAAFWAPLPAALSSAGYGGDATFALYLATSLTSAVCYRGVGELSSRFDVCLLQSGALGVRAGVFPVVALFGTAGLLGLSVAGGLFAILGATWAVIAVTGTAVVTRLAPPSARGEVLGVHAALVAASGGVGGLLGGWVAEFGYLVAFGVAAALVALGAGVVASLRGLSTRSRSGAELADAESGQENPTD